MCWSASKGHLHQCVVKVKLGLLQGLWTKVALLKKLWSGERSCCVFGFYLPYMILGSGYRLCSGSEATKQFQFSQYGYCFYENLPKKTKKHTEGNSLTLNVNWQRLQFVFHAQVQEFTYVAVSGKMHRSYCSGFHLKQRKVRRLHISLVQIPFP